jgi:DNA-binding response OmpR family regulator
VKILLVEDDVAQAASIVRLLRRHAYQVVQSLEETDIRFQLSEGLIDLIVLDLGLPGPSGLDRLKAWRASGIDTPVVVLTARDSWHERVDGLRAGADDYLGKPFHHEELLARIEAVLARTGRTQPGQLRYGPWRVQEGFLTHDNGEEKPLTVTEYRLLRFFLLHRGQTLSKRQLLDHVWDEQKEPGDNAVEVYISRLREKLGRESIRTQRGLGYQLSDPA